MLNISSKKEEGVHISIEVEEIYCGKVDDGHVYIKKKAG